MTLISQNQRKQPILPPAQVGPLDRDVLVLRKLNAKKIPDGVYTMLAEQHIHPGIAEGLMPWFKDGYVSNDMPRTTQITEFVLDATEGFAIARTDNGEILREFGPEDLAKADAIVSKARVELAIKVQLEAEEETLVEEESLEDDQAQPVRSRG